jgi:hypothetical protein
MVCTRKRKREYIPMNPTKRLCIRPPIKKICDVCSKGGVHRKRMCYSCYRGQFNDTYSWIEYQTKEKLRRHHCIIGNNSTRVLSYFRSLKRNHNEYPQCEVHGCCRDARHLDHDHKTHKIRGFVCHKHNNAFRLFDHANKIDVHFKIANFIQIYLGKDYLEKVSKIKYARCSKKRIHQNFQFYRVVRSHGSTQKYVTQQLKKQDDQCLVPGCSHSGDLVVDHVEYMDECRVRGLMCISHNAALHKFERNLDPVSRRLDIEHTLEFLYRDTPVHIMGIQSYAK